MKTVRAAFFALLAFATTAQAEVLQSGPDHFTIAFAAEVAAPPARSYAAITAVQHWWSSAHTWSGDAANLSLKAEAGGCFCERWKQGSSEHGRVIMVRDNELLRLDSALGPLQELAVSGILSFRLEAGDEDTTRLDVDYRVNGSSASGLDQIAPAVDQVLALQIDRLLRYIDTGNPEAAAAATPEPSPSRRDARAKLIEEWGRQAAAAKAVEKKPAPVDQR
ncbi:SRPBCC family protein [Dokdonella immobilis]|uniref:Polyketide cyclase / dehydrase and lipid transport n=1 Tax=Dokdonella immobilis TaxID=578942 RepID=A0A1I4YPD6_9GAMM|nr:hypothetical protein [Dokdonella immobilis]SFN39470.1 hypothetical protein SAMN05216289_11882 [Dokdonella immobilis]